MSHFGAKRSSKDLSVNKIGFNLLFLDLIMIIAI